jgi:RimJ/RimL family protein N-acetyltransferase
VIRPATPDDEPALRRLDRDNWSTLHSPAPLPPGDRPFETAGVLVAELQDGIAGYVKLGPVLAIKANEHVLEIKGLTVDARHRGHGMGKALMHAAIRQAREAGARKLTLRVLGHNPHARAVYEACGFQVEGVLRDFFLLDGRYVDDVLMSLALTDGGSSATP